MSAAAWIFAGVAVFLIAWEAAATILRRRRARKLDGHASRDFD